MTRLILVAATVLSFACATTTKTVSRDPVTGAPQSKTLNGPNGSLKPIGSERALKRLVADIRRERQRQQAEEARASIARCESWAKADNIVGINCKALTMETVTVAGAAAPRNEDTNTQHAGVDEGGIVKKVGDVLVVLRRGRLFTIDTAGGQLVTVDSENLGGLDGTTPSHRDWYDELLVADHTVVVIGYSSARGGTEIVLFDLTARGDLDHRETYQLRSDDYYSGENYASRLIGTRLLLFTSRWLPGEADGLDWLPALRRWQTGATFEPIASPDRIFLAAAALGANASVHTLVSCDLAAVPVACAATVLLGGGLDVYYASPTAAYVWTSPAEASLEPLPSMLYRVPFDGGNVSALQVQGVPPNQLAFLESDDHHLNVVVSHPNDVTTLLRIPVAAFADGSTSADASHYRSLATGIGWPTVRFVGDYVLLGASEWSHVGAAAHRLVVSQWRGGPLYSLRLSHDVARIEAMADNAVVAGADGMDLGMTTIRLASEPSVAGTLRHGRAFESETRSHAFLYRAESERLGVFGLPIVSPAEEDSAEASASVMFIRNQDLALTPVGALAASPVLASEDHCVVSCTDWYGNARPLFSADRVFALLGYELVEGRWRHGRIEEVRRLDFTPQAPAMK